MRSHRRMVSILRVSIATAIGVDFSKMWGIEWQDGGKTCRIRRCAERHEVRICIDCPDFPCQMLDEFHKQGYKKARENLFRMKEIGVREWLAERQK